MRLWCTTTLLAVALVLAGCATTDSGSSTAANNPYYDTDRPPPQDIDVSAIPDAVPRVEPVTRAGNKNPYTVLGKTWRILPTSRGYRARGVASWYGTKFHGEKTANGETYDMFAMTAAHKTLPIPAYAKVTNLENGRSVIVRINDRGPFLHERIIDLSYAAAKKLGYSDKGTARVEVEAIDPEAWHRERRALADALALQKAPQGEVSQSNVPQSNVPQKNVPQKNVSPQNASPKEQVAGQGKYLQAGAFSSAQSAQKLQARVKMHTRYPVEIRSGQSGAALLYKVIIGPIVSAAELLELRRLLQHKEKLSPFLIQD